MASFLFNFFILFNNLLFATSGSDGWSDVGKRLDRNLEKGGCFSFSDASSETGLLKRVGAESFFIQFPEKPTTFWEEGVFVARCEKKGRVFELRVQNKGDFRQVQRENTKVLHTEENIYQITPFLEGEKDPFSSSFRIVFRGKIVSLEQEISLR